MFVENVDGGYRRSPADCANLLARKLALAFAAGGAGAIQWLWNTNVYMDSDNEVGIGFLRADGTEKPELDVFRGMARFLWENRHRMVGRKWEETVVVIPHSGMFSVRDQTDFATRRAIRALEYRLGIPTRTVSEYRVQDIGDPKWMIVPSPRVLTESCWEALLAQVEAGAHLLISGFIEADAYRRFAPRLAPFGLETAPRPALHFEPLEWEDGEAKLMSVYAGDSTQKVDCAMRADGSPLPISTFSLGAGKIVYCPLPIELAQSESQTSFVYGLCVPENVEREGSAGSLGVLVRRIEFAEADLFLILNESARPVSEREIAFGTPLATGQTALFFVRKGGKAVVAHYP